MNKKELETLIESIIKKVLNEDHEIIKAQGLIKDCMFKIKKDLDSLYESWKKLGYIESFKTILKPYNTGYIIDLNLKINYEAERVGKISKEIEKLLGHYSSISYQPGSFFQDYLEEGKGAYLEGYYFLSTGGTKNLRQPIKTKNDIKPAIDEFYKLCTKEIEHAKKLK